MSYCLVGLFNVSMPVIYGEGADRARMRLLDEIQRSKNRTYQEFQIYVEWLSPSDPWSNHAAARRSYHPGTGEWLLQSLDYKRWKSSLSRHLWLAGKAGCGKTVLCSSVIEDIQSCITNGHLTENSTIGCGAFYFSFSDIQKQTYDSLVRSLIVQLGCVDTGISRLKKAHDVKPDGSTLQVYELEEILLCSIKAYDVVFILIDALDESPEGDQRQEMLSCFNAIRSDCNKCEIVCYEPRLIGHRCIYEAY